MQVIKLPEKKLTEEFRIGFDKQKYICCSTSQVKVPIVMAVSQKGGTSEEFDITCRTTRHMSYELQHNKTRLFSVLMRALQRFS